MLQFFYKKEFCEKNETKYFDRRIAIVDESKEINGDTSREAKEKRKCIYK